MHVLNGQALARLMLLAGLALALAACGPAQAPPGTGPTARLSDDELFRQADTNTRQLRSFHFEMRKEAPGATGALSNTLTVTGDVQGDCAAFRLHVTHEALGPVDLVSPADVGAEFFAQPLDLLGATNGEFYASIDGGQSWIWLEGEAGSIALLVWPPCKGTALSGTPGAQPTPALAFRAASPPREAVDGVRTRHLVADTPAGSYEVWIAGEITPTIRQTRLTGRYIPTSAGVRAFDALTFLPDGRTLLSADGFSQNVWRWATDGAAGSPARRPIKAEQVDGIPWLAAFSPDGRWLAGAMNYSHEISLWNLDSAALDRVTLAAPGSDKIHALVFGATGRVLAAAGEAGLYLWTAPFGQAPPAVLPSAGYSGGLAFSPDMGTLASADGSDGVSVYDLAHPEAAPRRLALHYAKAVAFGPDHLLAALNDTYSSAPSQAYSVHVWDLRQPDAPPVVLAGDVLQPGALAFSPSEPILAASARNRVRVWDLRAPGRTATPYNTGQSDPGVYALAFSPNGKQLAAAGGAGQIRLWPVAGLFAPGGAPTPAVLQQDARRVGLPYTLTYRWSRLNEPVGPLDPPPTPTPAPGE